MKKYTVVVLYPQANRDAYGQTYTAHVEAKNAFAARAIGRLQAWRKQENLDRGLIKAWLPLLVFEGHINPLAWGWQAPAFYQ